MVGWRASICRFGLAGVLASSFVIVLGERPSFSQLIPDQTLGAENSVVNRIDALNQRIEGGASRGANLFHSFFEFNVDEGKSVYFSNPEGIDNILSRVTGSDSSVIYGRLGVLGDANLYLLNPKGIVFGQNASLDIPGSFVATTAERITLGSRGVFSALQPQESSLLSVAPGVLFFNQLNSQEGTISSSGNLTVGKDLDLAAGNLDLQGQLFAGNNLNLRASDTVKIRDSGINPFIANAGVGLLVQGDRQIDIFALNHPNSGLFSGKDLVLRSASTVSGDAHFWSGGNFQIEQLDGNLGGLFSPLDPIIRASGDIILSNYTGASLQIFAGGSVFIPGTVRITGTESPANSIVESVTLSDGTTISINATAAPTLDIRAGTTVVGYPFLSTEIPTNADIVLGRITFDPIFGNGGKVFLTNQYQPNTLPLGEIIVSSIKTNNFFGDASVNIDARSNIIINSISLLGGNISLKSNADIFAVNSFKTIGGKIKLDARDNIFLSDPNTQFLTFGGGIQLVAQQNILLDKKLKTLGGQVKLDSGGDIFLNSLIDTFGGQVKLDSGGDIFLNNLIRTLSGQVKLDSEGDIFLNSLIDTFGGQVKLDSGGDIFLTRLFGTTSFTDSIRSWGGKIGLNADGDIFIRNIVDSSGGEIQLTSQKDISLSGLLGTIASQGGNVLVDAKGKVFLSDKAGIETSPISHVGDSGDIRIKTESLIMESGAQLVPTNRNGGKNIGDISVKASGNIILSGQSTGFISSISPGTEGQGGDIDITSRSLSLKNGAQIQTILFRGESGGTGTSGDINVQATEFVNLSGTSPDGYSSGLFASTEKGADGDAGNITVNTGDFQVANGAIVNTLTANSGKAGEITITANNLDVTGGGQIVSTTRSSGNAGNIVLKIQDQATFSGNDPNFVERFSRFGEDIVNNQGPESGVFANANTDSTGAGQTVTIEADKLVLDNGALLTSRSQGIGKAGNFFITLGDTLQANNGEISTTADSAAGGEINITAKDIRLQGDSDIRTNVANGIGGGGNLTLTANSVIAFDDSDILAFAKSGKGGNITLNTPAYFANNFRLDSTTADPDTLDNNNNPDINASGAVSGTITIPDVSFIQNSLNQLPEDLADTENLVANSCLSRTRKQKGTFTITGAGGLPLRPGDAASSPYPTGEIKNVGEQTSSTQWKIGDPIVEPQGAYQLDNGQIVLSRECSKTLNL